MSSFQALLKECVAAKTAERDEKRRVAAEIEMKRAVDAIASAVVEGSDSACFSVFNDIARQEVVRRLWEEGFDVVPGHGSTWVTVNGLREWASGSEDKKKKRAK